MDKVAAEHFLEKNVDVPIIDVRSPGEFEEGHIPGAINIPLFTNKERAVVGTAYKQKGRQEAILLGLGYVGPKMEKFARKARRLAVDSSLKVHCWRGGMRSQNMAWLFEQSGMHCTVLDGGYKAYRNFILHKFAMPDNLLVLQGKTGSGKTEILRCMKELGEQVIDLEELANHKGSAFGGLGMGEQPTTPQFQNNIYAAMQHFNFAENIWIESESMTVGKVYLPETLWEKMNSTTLVEIRVDRVYRIERLVQEYGSFPEEDLEYCISKLKQRLGGNNVHAAIQLLKEGRIEEVADLLLMYYDKGYAFSSDKYKNGKAIRIQLKGKDPLDHARQILEEVNQFAT